MRLVFEEDTEDAVEEPITGSGYDVVSLLELYNKDTTSQTESEIEIQHTKTARKGFESKPLAHEWRHASR